MLRWAEYLEISGFSNMMSKYNQPVSLKNLAPNSTAQNIKVLIVKLLWSEGLMAKVLLEHCIIQKGKALVLKTCWKLWHVESIGFSCSIVPLSICSHL
jgi:hypothetical protein